MAVRPELRVIDGLPISTLADEEVQVFKAPSDGCDIGRAWVLRLQARDVDAIVVKVYPASDHIYCQNERKVCALIAVAAKDVGTPAMVILGERSCIGVASAFSFISGRTLASNRGFVGWEEHHASVIARLIESFSPIHVAVAAPSKFQFSRDQGIHFWTTDGPTLPALTWKHHRDEFECDIDRARLLRTGRDRLRAEWSARIGDFGTLADKVTGTVHQDLNADNIILCREKLNVIDLGLASRSSLFNEWGGGIAHLGLRTHSVFVEHATRWAVANDLLLSPPEVEMLLGLFAVKRATRRLAYLSDLKERSGANVAYVDEHARRQIEIICNIPMPDWRISF